MKGKTAMPFEGKMQGKEITMNEMLEARELRAVKQRELLEHYGMTLISFTLNIAGPVKTSALIEKTFNEGRMQIGYRCTAERFEIIHREENHSECGWELFAVLNAPAKSVKAAMCRLEERSGLGRLFDIDVIDADGHKVSRTELGLEGRRCLICGESAAACGRSRRHSVAQLQQRTAEIINEYFASKRADEVSSAAVRALQYEVMTTPKPGLVDQKNSGAHRDMDMDSFFISALELRPAFRTFFLTGVDNALTESGCFARLRETGVDAEACMRMVTKGVNTHKGAIFSMGIFCAALGRMWADGEPLNTDTLRLRCIAAAAPVAADFAGIQRNAGVTAGEKLFAAEGITGVRGEALKGFPTLFETALPRYRELRAAGLNRNDAGAITLPAIIAAAEDTNIAARTSAETMRCIRAEFDALMKCGLTAAEWLDRLNELDVDFIRMNISPGGSADILALVYFVDILLTGQA